MKEPHTIYLCQTENGLSCAACCGLYNRSDVSRNRLETILSDRTEGFMSLKRDPESILSFGRDVEERESNIRRYPDFHHCPYIGFIGRDPIRVGCLLHPRSEGNHGIDYRGLSHYGGMACHMYFCPSGHHLSPDIKSIIQQAADHWYIYGLTVTEKTMWELFFDQAKQRLKRPISAQEVIHRPRALKTIHEFMYLKLTWSFRPEIDPGLCHYFFKDRKYQKSSKIYAYRHTSQSRYHDLFQELVSWFDSMESLRRAEAVIDAILDRFGSILD